MGYLQGLLAANETERMATDYIGQSEAKRAVCSVRAAPLCHPCSAILVVVACCHQLNLSDHIIFRIYTDRFVLALIAPGLEKLLQNNTLWPSY